MSDSNAPLGHLTGQVSKLAIAVTFHFVPARLSFLRQIATEFEQLADQVEVYVITNVTDSFNHSQIRQALSLRGCEAQILAPALLGHPFLLTWCHREIFRQRFDQDPGISHFLYLEDDIQVGPHNIEYWLRGRKALRPLGLIPSFLRFERRGNQGLNLATDIINPVDRHKLPNVRMSGQYSFLNMPNPYQAMYLLDRELMAEMIDNPKCGPEFGTWGIREKAAQGVTFSQVPDGCFSRNFVGFDTARGKIDPGCLVHHTPNNYADDPNSRFGKIAIEDLVLPLNGAPATAARELATQS